MSEKVAINPEPLVTVVIPSYNHVLYIRDAIQSIIAQNYRNIEFLIIDDGSKDNSVEEILKLKASCEARFERFEFRHRENKGLCATLNEALAWAKGEYFSVLASDDVALPHKIDYLVNKITLGTESAVFGLVEQMGNKAGILNKSDKVHYNFEDIFLQRSTPSAPAALMSTQVLKELKGFNESIKLEDWYMWLKMLAAGAQLTTYPEVVTLYRQHEHNTVNNNDFMYHNREAIIALYKTHPFYEEAKRRNTLKRARDFAYDQPLNAFHYLLQSRCFGKDACFVLLKILMPQFLIRLSRQRS